MKKTALFKNLLREIKSSKSRLVSLIVMVALGTLVVLGLSITGPSMRMSLDQKLKNEAFPDLIVTSTYGLAPEDQALIERLEGVETLEYGYQKDLILKDSDLLVRLESMGELPKYQVIEGRLPEKQSEIALDYSLKNQGYQIGEMISFLEPDRQDVNEELVHDDYEIVGYIQSPEYFMEGQKGISPLGKSEIKAFGLIDRKNFNMANYSLARILLTDLKDLDFTDPRYEKYVQEKKDELDEVFESRPKDRLDSILLEVNQKIKDSELDLSKAEKDLSEGEKKLLDGKNKVKEGFDTYQENKDKFEEGKIEGQKKLSKAKQVLVSAEKELKQNTSLYDQGVKDFESEKATAYKKLDQAKSDLELAEEKVISGQKSYDQGLKDYQDKTKPYQDKLVQAEKDLASSKKDLDQGEIDYQKGLEKFNTEISNVEAEISKNEAVLGSSLSELEDGERRLSENQAKIDQGLSEITAGRAELEGKKLEVTGKIAELEGQLNQLNHALDPLITQREDLTNKKSELANAIASLDSQIQALEAQKAYFETDPNLGPDEKAQTIAGIEAKIQALQEKKTELETSLGEVESGIAQLDQTIPGLEGQKAQLEGGLAQLKLGLDEIVSKEKLLNTKEAELKQGQAELDKAKADLEAGWASYQSGLAKLEAGKSELESKKAQGQRDLDLAKKKLEDGKAKYQEGLKTFQENKAKFQEENKLAIAKLDQAKKDLDEGKEKLAQGKAEIEKNEKTLKEKLDQAKNKLDSSKVKLDSGWEKFRTGKAEYENSKQDFEEKILKSSNDLKTAYQDLLDKEKELNDSLDEFDDKKIDASKDIEEGREKIRDKSKDLSRLRKPKYQIKTPDNNMAINLYKSNSKRMDLLSFIFPVFFYAIAMLVTLTTMSRMVDEERSEIGTLKALGYKNFDIGKKYLSYALVPALVGSILGVILAYRFISGMIFTAYSSNFNIGSQILVLYPSKIIFSMILSLALILLTVYLSIKANINNKPASLLRPKAPKMGTRILLERITPLWKRLSFLHKVTLRNIFRYKARMLMTLIGVAGCTGLLFMGFGIKDSIVQIAPLHFQEISKFDLLSINDDKLKEEEVKVLNDHLDSNEEIESRLKVAFDSGVISRENLPDTDFTFIIYKVDEDFYNYINLRERKTEKTIDLEQDGIIMTEKLAKIAGVKEGDTILLEDKDLVTHSFKVAKIAENYINHYVYMSENYYKEVMGQEANFNADLIKLKNKEKARLITEDLAGRKEVLSIINNSKLFDQIDDLLKALNLVVLVLITISSLLAIVVLYNLTNINISERLRELSTIKVLGFYPLETTQYVYRETFLLSLLGILLGYVFGYILHWLIINIIAPDIIMMSPKILASNYLLSGAITLGLSLIIMVIMHNKLKKVDMVEALKGVE